MISEDVFGFVRAFGDPSNQTAYPTVVIINLGGTATKVNLKDLIGEDFNYIRTATVRFKTTNSPQTWRSFYESNGDFMGIDLGAYDALVLELSSSDKISVSFMLIVLTLIKVIL